MKDNISKEPAVSVIIPTADRQDMLLVALGCALAQNFSALEILVVDNGVHPIDSTKIPSGVTVIRTAPRIGPGRARNIGAKAASGKYIAFLDDDDLWGNDYLEKVAQSIMEMDADIVLARLMHRQKDNALKEYKMISDRLKDLRRVFYSNPGVVGTNITIKRKLFLEIDGFDETMPSSEDRDLLARLLTSGAKIVSQPCAIAILCDHFGERAHHNIITGNWKFIKKHWKHMRLSEIFFAVRVLLIRIANSKEKL